MGTVQEFSDVTTVVGTPTEIRSQLAGVQADQVVAVTLPHASASTAQRLSQALASIVPMVEMAQERHEQEVWQAVVDALVVKAPPEPTRLREARMLARARNAVLAEGDWWTAAQIAEVAGFSTTNPSAQPNRWKRSGQIFAIPHNGVDYYPAYGLDAESGYRPLNALAPILQVFDGKKDAWGMAYWFDSVNSFLGGQRPKDLLATAPARVVEAAEDEVHAIAHG